MTGETGTMERKAAGGDRVLSVSYGLFSCTLDGFDDPVALVRELTGWFQDVAARDRLFGTDGTARDALRDHGVEAEADRGDLRLRAAGGGGDIVSRLVRMRGAATLATGEPVEAPRVSEESRVEEDEDDVVAQFTRAIHGDADSDADARSVADHDAGNRDAGAAVSDDPDRAAPCGGGLPDGPDDDPDGSAEEETDDDPDFAAILSATLRDEGEDGDADARCAPDREPEAEEADRLFAATESRLADDGGERRRDALSHERSAADDMDEEGDDDGLDDDGDDGAAAYRDDLDRAVRPRRAHAPEGGRPTDRPSPTDGAGADDDGGAVNGAEGEVPLRLTAEQRVPEDAPEGPPGGGIRPRRVRRVIDAADDESALLVAVGINATAGDDAFPSFAEENRVTSLGELLEAAAAYTVLESGDDIFERSAVLALATDARPESSEADALRSFGQLLRRGHVVKAGRGLFELTEASRFHAISKRALV